MSQAFFTAEGIKVGNWYVPELHGHFAEVIVLDKAVFDAHYYNISCDKLVVRVEGLTLNLPRLRISKVDHADYGITLLSGEVPTEGKGQVQKELKSQNYGAFVNCSNTGRRLYIDVSDIERYSSYVPDRPENAISTAIIQTWSYYASTGTIKKCMPYCSREIVEPDVHLLGFYIQHGPTGVQDQEINPIIREKTIVYALLDVYDGFRYYDRSTLEHWLPILEQSDRFGSNMKENDLAIIRQRLAELS